MIDPFFQATTSTGRILWTGVSRRIPRGMAIVLLAIGGWALVSALIFGSLELGKFLAQIWGTSGLR